MPSGRRRHVVIASAVAAGVTHAITRGSDDGRPLETSSTDPNVILAAIEEGATPVAILVSLLSPKKGAADAVVDGLRAAATEAAYSLESSDLTVVTSPGKPL